MTREEAIRILDPETTGEALAEIEYYNGFSGKKAAVHAVSDACVLAVSALREQEKQRWISVDDMLPEKAGTYFVVTKTGAVTYARFYPEHDLKDYKGEVFGHEKGSFQSNRKVLFWMPLPKPPKEEN